MSRLIKFTQEHDEFLEKVIEELKDTRFMSGKIKTEIEIPEVERKACIFFTVEAYAKMLSLIMSFDSEVGWYGTAHRHGELDDDVYIIDDILVFPQEVTGTTVDSDDERRVEWFESLPTETLLNIRCDFHSHVNMGTSPSGTDDKDVKAVVNNLDDDAFRIFMIWNKKLEFTCQIFDMAKNLHFGTEDVVVDVLSCEIADFINEANELVKKKVTTYQSTKSNSSTTKKSETKKASKDKKESEDIDALYEDLLTDDLFDDDYCYSNYYNRRRRSGYYGYNYY